MVKHKINIGRVEVRQTYDYTYEEFLLKQLERADKLKEKIKRLQKKFNNHYETQLP